jgi:hypothetical protein
VKSHDLAKKLLSMKNEDIVLSVDMENMPSDYRIFSTYLYDIVETNTDITLLFVDGEANE